MDDFAKELEALNKLQDKKRHIHRVQTFVKKEAVGVSRRTLYNVIGRVTRMRDPVRTRGTDYLVALFLCDPVDGDAGVMNVNLFSPCPNSCMDKRSQVGDVLLIRGIHVQTYGEYLQGVSVKGETLIENLSLKRRCAEQISIPDSLFNATKTDLEISRLPSKLPNLPVNTACHSITTATGRRSRKLRKIEQLREPNSFFDVLAQVVAIAPFTSATQNVLQIVVCDYTTNELLAPLLGYPQALQNQSRSKRETFMELCIYLWDEFAQLGAKTLKVDDVCLFGNVRLKNTSKSLNVELAGYLHGSRQPGRSESRVELIAKAPPNVSSESVLQTCSPLSPYYEPLGQILTRRCPSKLQYDFVSVHPSVPETRLCDVSLTEYPAKYRCCAFVSKLVPEESYLGLEAHCLNCGDYFAITPECLEFFSKSSECPLCATLLKRVQQVRVHFAIVLENLDTERTITALVDTQRAFELLGPVFDASFQNVLVTTGMNLAQALEELCFAYENARQKLLNAKVNLCLLAFKADPSTEAVDFMVFDTFST